MTQPDTSPDAGCGSLTLHLGPALSEFLRRESARRAIDPIELAKRLLMRGMHQQRLDDATRDLCPYTDAPTIEALLAARLEASAMLGAFGGWSAPDNGPPGPDEPASSTTRDIIERLRHQAPGCNPAGPAAPG